jgi:AcrR family transcriptional regulator
MNKAERTKNWIIRQSASLINKKGMAGTSLSDIMEVTKLAKGGIYGNFENKDAICLESFRYLTNNTAVELDEAAAKGKTAKEKFYSVLDFYKGNKIQEGGCPILNFGAEADDTHPEMKEEVKKVIRRAQKRIFNIISNGVETGEISPKIHPKNFSIKVFALIEGAILCRKVLDNDEQMKIVIAAIKSEFDTYLL